MDDSVPQSTLEKDQVDTKVNGPGILENQIAFVAVEDHTRPRTRSQTGNIVKRRLPEEPNTSSTQKSITPRKRLRTATKKLSSPPMDPDNNQKGHRTEFPIIDSRDESGATTRNSSPFSSTSPLTFLESVVSFGYAPDRRGPRSRATLPVPVPNLTKKSRGRRVPTQEAIDVPIDAKDKRMYVCKVEGCGKCFNRGEHLKRHIRSIHTHEKPFKCTHESCGKFFNRHDNLLQHLKVHKQISERPHPIIKLSELYPSLLESALVEVHTIESSESEAETPPPMNPPLQLTSPISYNSYVLSPHFEVPYESYITNIAVSSLRTELQPHSPPTSRVRDSL